MTQWYNICHKGINICLKTIPTYMVIPSAMTITSVNQASGYSICHSYLICQLSHMWCSICYMVKTSAYNNVAITSTTMTITSARHMWLTICHNINWSIISKNGVSISHYNISDYNICHKGILAIISLVNNICQQHLWI